MGKLFKVSEEIPGNGNYGDGSRGNKQRLNIQGSLNVHNISFIDLDIEEVSCSSPSHDPCSPGFSIRSKEENKQVDKQGTEHTVSLGENNNTSPHNEGVVYEKPSNHSSTASSESSNDSSLNYSTDEDLEECDEDEGEGDEGDEEEDEEEEEADESENDSESEDNMYSYMDNFPIQMICLEKCDGTIDQLFEEGELSKKEGAAAMMQIVMTLIAYQRAFSFTHNDLHTNNIMYVNTDIEFLYYKHNKKTYKVPTYGRIFKIIDFGRSIYRFCGKTFCSDSFAPGGDAATQYNFEPYMNEDKPRLDPNPSFDLCRLGCSIYDFLIEDESEDDMDTFQKTIYRWCCDDNGKNILYKRDGEERYPNFKLYKMIARTVHNHYPQAQLDYLFFSQFALSPKDVKKMGKNAVVMDIDGIPSYT